MELLTNLQFNLFTTLSKAKLNFKKSPKERLTTSHIETRLENLQSNWSTFFETHLKIVSSVKPAEFDKLEYNVKNLYEITEELFMDYKAELKEALRKTTKLETLNKPSVTSSIKLPKIELPTFKGLYSEWISFVIYLNR